MIIETVDLRKKYELPGEDLEVLKGVSYQVAPGEMSFILGRSGSGKSTLLHLIGGLDRPSSGDVLFEGKSLLKMKDRELSRLRNQRVGFVFQFYHLLPELSVYENVLLPMRISGKIDLAWTREVLKRVKLLSRKNHLPSELSGGEKQRVAIARALMNKPAVVLCDEPTGNLDEETAETVMSLIRDLNQQEGQAFVIVTHDESLAWQYRNINRLHDGLLVKMNEGKPGEMPPVSEAQ